MPTTLQKLRLPSGFDIEFGEYGDPSGRPLLFFHGWPSSQYQAISLDLAASVRGIRVIALNRPGIGGSTAQPGRTLADWPPLVREFVEILGITPCPVLGVSGGGPYALATAAELPDVISSVGVACGAVPLAEFSDLGDLSLAYRILIGLRKTTPWLISPLLLAGKWISKCPPNRIPMSLLLRLLSPCDREALRDPSTFAEVMTTFREAAAGGSGTVLSDADVYLQKWDVDLSQIRCPVYFWHGEKDGVIPIRMAKYLASKIPHAECRWFPEEGHFSLGFQKTDIFLDALFSSRPTSTS